MWYDGRTEHTILTHALNSLGLRFDPFAQLDASGDTRLSDYFVQLAVFAVAWSEAPTWIFAPPGGGKTATRVYATRACWTSISGPQPFPIPYVLDGALASVSAPSTEHHLRGLSIAGARALLMGIASRPERFFALTPSQQRDVAAFFGAALPGPLARYIDMLREEGNPAILPRIFDRTYQIPLPPEPKEIYALCDALEAAASQPAALAPAEQFSQLVRLVLGPLRFRSVFILLDGVDALPETGEDPAAAIDWIAPLFDRVAAWAEQRVFLKAFLPTNLAPLLATSHPLQHDLVTIAQLQWTAPDLAEIVRRRVFAASDGTIGSLDAISRQGLHDVEQILADEVPPIPREMLALVQRVLEEFAHRTQGQAGFLEPADLAAALQWYRGDLALRQLPALAG